MGCCGSIEDLEAEEFETILFPKSRKCTDVLWLVLYLVCLFSMMFIVVYYVPKADFMSIHSFEATEFGKTNFTRNLMENTKAIILCAVLACVLTIAVVAVMHWLSDAVIYVMIGTLSALLLAYCIFYWFLYYNSGSGVVLWTAIIITLAIPFWCYFVFSLFGNIKLHKMLYYEADQVLTKFPYVFLAAVVFFLFKTVMVTLEWFAFLILITMVYDRKAENLSVITLRPGEIAAFLLFTITSGWTFFFLSGCWQFLMAHVASRWYFERRKASMKSPIREGCNNLLRYHTGTIFLGSFISTIFKLVYEALEQLRAQNESNMPMFALFALVDYLVTICSGFWSVISTNAYYITVIQGFPFCKAGKRAYLLLKFNESLMVFLTADLIKFMCIIFIAFVSCVIASFFFHQSSLQDFWPSLAACLAISLAIPETFVDAYKQIVIALYMCLALDLEQHEHTDKPLYMSDTMMEYMNLAKSKAKHKSKSKKRVETEV